MWRVRAEPVEGEQDRCAERLDLQRPPELDLEAVADAARAERGEGKHDRREDRREDPRGDLGLPPPRPPVDDEEEQRQQDERILLGRDRDCEHGKRDAMAPGDDRGQRSGSERRRPEVEARERHLPEQCGRQADESGAPATGPQRERNEDDAARREQPLQHLRPKREARAREHGGKRERRQRAGRILHEEVAVRELAVPHVLAVRVVERRVADIGPVEELDVGKCRCRGEQSDPGERRG